MGSKKKLSGVENKIFTELKKQINNDFIKFLQEIFNQKDIKNINKLINKYETAEIGFKKVQDKLENLAREYKKDNDMPKNKPFSEIFEIFISKQYQNDVQKLTNLDSYIKQYNNTKNVMQKNLQEIVPYMIKFQTALSKKLGLSITFLRTTKTKVSYATYNSKDTSIQDILQISSDDIKIIEGNLNKIKKSKKSSTNIMPLVAIIKQEIDESKRRNKKEILNAITNEESTYREILNRYEKTKKYIYWQINGYNQAEQVSNKGPIEEARQGFLLRIHQKKVYELFQGAKTKAEDGSKIYKEHKITIEDWNVNDNNKGTEIMIHNFVRSKYGISSTDSRSGLIVDDHVFAAKEILDGVKKVLEIDENAKFISIASKTNSAGYAGFKQFFKLIKNLTALANGEITKKQVLDYIQNEFFMPGTPLTTTVENELNITFSEAQAEAEELIRQSVENKK